MSVENSGFHLKKEQKYIQIQWTCSGLAEARDVCQLLVEKRLVACANIIPQVESIYLWEGKVCRSEESKVILKTLASFFDTVKQFILHHTNYEVPEILCFTIEQGHTEYLDWIEQAVQPF